MRIRIRWMLFLLARVNCKISLMQLMHGIWIASWSVRWMLSVVRLKISR